MAMTPSHGKPRGNAQTEMVVGRHAAGGGEARRTSNVPSSTFWSNESLTFFLRRSLSIDLEEIQDEVVPLSLPLQMELQVLVPALGTEKS